MASASYCTSCGAPLAPESRFCGSCGQTVSATAPAMAQAASAAAVQAQTQYSPDGRWWWDGDQWVAVPAQASSAVAPMPAKRRKNRHWGVVLTIETIFCGAFTLVIAGMGAPPIFVGVFGIAALLFFVALVVLLLTRAARRSTGQQMGPTPPPMPTTGYSPDGSWFWDGKQWTPVRDQGPSADAAPAVAITPAVLPKPKKKSRVWYVLLVIVIAIVLGLLELWYLHWYEVLGIAVAGLALSAVTWLNPKGIGAMITKVGSRLRLPGIKSGATGRRVAILLVLDLALLPAGIGSLLTYKEVFAPTFVQLDGFSVVANPLTKATVTAYQMNSGGSAVTILGTTTTDKGGHYTLAITHAQRTRILVASTGGTYIDQVTNKPVAAATGDSLRSVLLSDSGQVSMTPLSTFATMRAVTLASEGESLDTSIDASFSAVANDYGLPDVSQTYPAIATEAPESQPEILNLPARQMGLDLSGLNEEAASLGVSDFAFINALTSDISDGDFDGMVRGKKGLGAIGINRTPITMLPANAIRGADKKKRDNSNNKLKVPTPDFFPGPVGLGLNLGGLDFISTSSLPAWRSDTQGSAAIRGSGGTKPYRCALEPGSVLPPGFTLSNQCVISGRGVKTTNTSISAGFTVRMTDSSHPNIAKSVDLNITTTPFPPVPHINGGQCPAVNQPCTIMEFATATGGTPPYSYQKEVMAPFPPLGMVLWSDGSLRGTPHVPGRSSEFSVCAVDIGGAIGCAMGSFTTKDTPSPTPSVAPKPGPGGVIGTWVSGPIEFTRTVGGCSLETDRYSGSKWVFTKQANGFAPLSSNQVGIAVTLDGGEIVSQSNPGCLNFNVYLNNPIAVYLGTISGSTMALGDADNPPVPQGSCTIGQGVISCTIDDGQHGGFDYATAPNGITLTKQK